MSVNATMISQQQGSIQLRVIRLFDIVVASIALVFALPLMIIVTLAILLETGRPVLFRHPRIGAFGQPFEMIKFRKFYHTPVSNGFPLTLADDKRMSKVGKFLAHSKLDELPQIWNVLRGDMAIVGPRPESLEFLDCYRNGFEEVLQHKPGIFGPSQIFFRDESYFYPPGEDPTNFYRTVIFPTKAGLDIAYFRHRTIFSDLAWLFRIGIALLRSS
jgi:lipopolysaccharide/colanic/teichoic acid biosynthesis glycosyltransferase